MCLLGERSKGKREGLVWGARAANLPHEAMADNVEEADGGIDVVFRQSSGDSLLTFMNSLTWRF